MKEEIETEEINIAERGLWDEISWEKVAYNNIEKKDFLRVISTHDKVYSTFLGNQEQLQFYMFKPVAWPVFKEIRKLKLDKESTHERIIMDCIIWPKMNQLELNGLEAGVVLTLVHQILAVSNFLKNPDKALEMILEVK